MHFPGTRTSTISFGIDLNVIEPIYYKKYPPWLFDNHYFIRKSFPTKNELNSNSLRKHFCKIAFKFANFAHIYTDASKCDDSVGIGIHHRDFEYVAKISDQPSIFDAEMAAIYIHGY